MIERFRSDMDATVRKRLSEHVEFNLSFEDSKNDD